MSDTGMPSFVGRQYGDVGRGVHRLDVRSPSDEMGTVAERGEASPQIVEQLTIARNDESRVGNGGPDEARDLGESIGALHLREARDERHHGGVGRHSQHHTRLGSRKCRRQSNAGRHDHVLVRPPDLRRAQLVTNLGADRYETCRASRVRALHFHHGFGNARREVAVEEVPVESVHASPRSTEDRRAAPEDSGLRGVCMHDVGAERTDLARQRRERTHVAGGVG
jgi:hypothetical protein